MYRALKRAKVSSGQRLAVFGIGGLGHIAVQIGRALGAEIAAIDISEEKLALANSLGASHTFHAGSTDTAKALRRMGGVHVALVTSAAKAAYDLAFRCVRPSGTLLIVGLPAEDICFPPVLMAAKRNPCEACSVGTRKDLLEVLAMAAAGKIHCHVTTRPLAEVNEALDQLRQGRISGRTVLIP